MELDSLDLAQFLAFLVMGAAAAYLASRRLVGSMFEIWVGIPVQQALIVAYAAYGWWAEFIEPAHAAFILISLAAFAAGTWVLPDDRHESEPAEPEKASAEHVRFLRYTLIALCALQGLADLVFFAVRGIPILNEGGTNPLIYQGGFGVVKYLHDANYAGITAIAFLLLVLAQDKRAFLLGMAFVTYPLMLMEWSKSALIGVFMLLYTMNRYTAWRFGVSARVSKRFLWAGVAVSLAFLAFRFSGVAETGYAESTTSAIGKRLLNTADAVFMYFQLGGHEYFEGEIGLVSYVFSSLTPYLGISQPAQDFWVNLQRVTLGGGQEGYGSYPPFQVVGHLTLGWGGVAYAFAIGLALAFVKQMKVGLRYAVPYFVLLYAAQFLAGNSAFFAYYLFCQIFNLPAFVAAVIAYRLLGTSEKSRKSQVPATP